jgi:prevent-host-death family protein
MTYDMTMSRSQNKSLKSVQVSSASPGRINIATLKAKLAQYLRLVRAGQDFIVLDRQKPVAKIIPFSAEDGLMLESVAPKQNWKSLIALLKANDDLSPKTTLKKTALEYLKEDRKKE